MNSPFSSQKKTVGALKVREVIAPLFTSVVLLLLQTQWLVMNDERSGLWLQQTEHIPVSLWQRYSVTVSKVMMATVNLSKWWLQFNICYTRTYLVKD